MLSDLQVREERGKKRCCAYLKAQFQYLTVNNITYKKQKTSEDKLM